MIFTRYHSEGSFVDDVSSVAESEPLSLADQSVGGSENWEGSDVSVGKEECKFVYNITLVCQNADVTLE